MRNPASAGQIVEAAIKEARKSITLLGMNRMDQFYSKEIGELQGLIANLGFMNRGISNVYVEVIDEKEKLSNN